MKKRSCLVLVLVLAACAPNGPPPTELSSKPALELRAMQTRVFETSDQLKTVRAMIAALQDLGYTLDKVDAGTGTVSATKLALLRLTATAYPRGEGRMVVRANAMVSANARNTQVDAPEFYQKYFFEPLSKALFLQALEASDADAGSVPAASATFAPATPGPSSAQQGK